MMRKIATLLLPTWSRWGATKGFSFICIVYSVYVHIYIYICIYICICIYIYIYIYMYFCISVYL